MNNINEIHGINISVYRPKDDKKYSRDDLVQYIRKFQLNEALRLIGELSYNILMKNNAKPFINIFGVPISDSLLAHLSMNIIECSNDYRKELITLENIATIADMYYGLPDPFLDDNNLEEFLLRFGSHQFDFDREINNIVSRTFLIYCKLWDKVKEAKKVNIPYAIEKIANLSIENILALGYGYFAAASHGFFRKLSNDHLHSQKDKQIFSEDNQNNFLNWISCTYQEFRVLATENLKSLVNIAHEKNRFNPLIKNPVIKPDKNPRPDLDQVYLVPVIRLLIERITHGLYFDFSDFYMRPGKSNDFRRAFGFVFQEYVGHLIKNSTNNLKIKPEWKYNKRQKSTPDWIIFDNDNALFIEVKQSGLYLQAKTMGEVKEIEKNLKRTISRAVQQFWLFEEDIRSNKFKELHCLNNIKKIERLVVTYDRTYYSNSILRKHSLEVAKRKINQIPDDFYWHTISIEEFEHVLSINEINLLNFLEKKRNKPKARDWDFREYIAREYPKNHFYNPYLENIKKEFVNYVNKT